MCTTAENERENGNQAPRDAVTGGQSSNQKNHATAEHFRGV